MHAVVITFTSQAKLAEVAEPFRAYAEALNDVEGLVSKTWIVDGTTFGGFYVFEDTSHGDAYLGSDLWGSVTANPAFSDFDIRRFGIADELTAITSPVRAARA